MEKKQLPNQWQTARVSVEDSTPGDVHALQLIHDEVPQTRGWTSVQAGEEQKDQIQSALKNGVLPPGGTIAFFRLQSIRFVRTHQLIGFLGVYHGFPQEDIFWINTLTIHPDFQNQGYGTEIMIELCNEIRKLGCYSRLRTFVPLTNWPSLRMCAKVGLDKIVEIVGDKVHAIDAESHVLLEKVIQ